MAGELDAVDRCSVWWDGWPTWLGGTGSEWRHCCKLHDDYYDTVHPFLEYAAAHWDLAKCVAKVSPLMAVVMFLGLMSLGTFHLIWIKNKLSKGKRK